MAGESGGMGAALKTLRLILAVCFIVLCAQVYLNEPEDRSVVACWPIYRGYQAVLVGGARIFLPKEQAFHLTLIRHAERMHNGCLRWAGHIPGFK